MAYDHLATVKNLLGITGTYQDDTIKAYIEEAKGFMLSAGITQDIIDSSKSTGLIARGVSDLWNYGSGGASLSPYFYQRCTQLVYECKSHIDGESCVEPITNEEIDHLIE